jgi:hypothetical protein
MPSRESRAGNSTYSAFDELLRNIYSEHGIRANLIPRVVNTDLDWQGSDNSLSDIDAAYQGIYSHRPGPPRSRPARDDLFRAARDQYSRTIDARIAEHNAQVYRNDQLDSFIYGLTNSGSYDRASRIIRELQATPAILPKVPSIDTLAKNFAAVAKCHEDKVFCRKPTFDTSKSAATP